LAALFAVTAAQAQETPDGASAKVQAAAPEADVGTVTPPPPAIALVPVPPGVPAGIWLLPQKAAVQIYDCGGLLCGRVAWLQRPRNPEGQLVIDKKNPDPALRLRPLCGMVVLWGLRPAGPDRWNGGWLYNPDDGTTYRVNGEFRGADTLVVRIYLGFPLFGQTSIWQRVPRLSSEGWC
jgi:uncharacterized protein (DUF2147 family)